MDDILFRAILSLDSYNRGYDQGITLTEGGDEKNKVIGDATVLIQSSTQSGSSEVQNSFYAIAYTTSSGTIISYRGTDEISNDVPTAYSIGGGAPWEEQALDAFNFYNKVVEEAYGDASLDPRQTNITLTGHSLGGGLAGLVASVYSQDATIFDNMAFELAAERTYTYSDPYNNNYDEDGAKAAYRSFTPWATPVPSSDLNLSNIRTFYTDGEILESNRELQVTPQTSYSIGYDVNLEGFDSGILGDNLHSMATLVMLIYGTPTGSVDPAWYSSAKYFWPVAYDDDFALSIGAGRFIGTLNDENEYAIILREALAYSALEKNQNGTGLIFGDTGIHAFFDDANDLGARIADTDSGSLFDIYGTVISQAFVEFAATLAFNKIEQTNFAGALNGVLSYDATNNLLSVDFSDLIWNAAGEINADDIVSRGDIAAQAITSTGELEFLNAMGLTWETTSYSVFDRVIFASVEHGYSLINTGSDSQHTLVIANGSDAQQTSRIEVDYSVAGDFMIIGSDASDIIITRSGNDIISGGAGDDDIEAGLGKNVIYGGAGNDTLRFSSGDNTAYGGADEDKFYLNGSLKGSYFGEGENDIFYAGFAGGILTSQASYALIATADGGMGTDTLSVTSSGYLEMTGTATSFKLWDSVADQYVTFQNVEIAERNSSAGSATITVLAGNAAAGALNYTGSMSVADQDYTGFNSFDYSQKQSALSFTGSTSSGLDFVSVGSHSIYNPGSLVIRGTNHGDTAVELKNTVFISGYGDDDVSTLSGNVTYVYNGGDDIIETNNDTTLILKVAANVSYDDVADWSWSNITLNSTDNYYYGTFHLLFDNGDTLSVEGRRLYLDGQSPNYSTQVVFEDVLKSVTFKHDDTFTEATYTQSTVNAGTWGNDSFTAVDTIGGEYSALGGNDTFTGSDVTDIAYMGAGNDTADGGAGNDYLFGQKGDDTLTGGSGNDLLDGGEGNDELTGGLGDDDLRGGYGNDTYIYSAGDGVDEITEYLNEGYDKLYIYGYTETQLNFTTLGNDFIVELLDGTDLITFTQGGVSGGYSDITQRIEEIYLNDVLLFGGGYAFPGNTTLTGSSSGDTLFGGEGYNLIEAGAGNDTIYGNGGNDELFGEGDNDTIYGGNGDDYLDGGDGNDVLEGGAGDDEIYGGLGADTISGGSGNDTLVGGKGDDLYKYAQGDGNVTIIGNEGDGSNTLWLTDLNVADIRLVTQYLDTTYGSLHGLYIQSLLDSSDVINIISPAENTNLAYYDLFLNAITTLRFADDTVWDLTQGLTIDADGWVDLTMNGSSGNDIIIGSTGTDSLFGREGNDTLYGVTGGEDYLVGGAGEDIYHLGGTDTHVVDESGNSTIYSGAGVNLIEVAQNSSNTIHTGYGEDTLVGYGVGIFPTATNTIYLHNYDKTDLTYTLTASDFTVKTLLGDTLLTIMTFGQTYNNLTFRFDGEAQNGYTLSDLIQMPTNGDNHIDFGSAQQGVNVDLLAGDDYVTGSNYDDVILGGDGNDTLIGQLGNDTLNGGAGDDILDGVNGNNIFVFDPDFGNDIIQFFVPGHDKIDLSAFTGITLLSQLQINDVNGDAVITFPGETGSITVSGRGDHDWNGGNFIWSDGSNGNNNVPTNYDDSLLGTENGDVIYALNGNDTVHGFDGADQIYGDNGDDVLYGDDGDDTLRGYNDNDQLYGGSGDDDLDGGSGNDVVDGGDGNDIVRSSQGIDVLDGGAGTDFLYFSNSGSYGVIVSLADNQIYNDGWGNIEFITNFENVWSDNTLDSTVIGNDQANEIYTGNGNDVIYGMGGDDLLSSGSGFDTIVFEGAFGNDAINDFWQGQDKIDLSSFTNIHSISDLVFTSAANNGTLITSAQWLGQSIHLWGVSSLTSDDFIFAQTLPTENGEIIYGTEEADTIDSLGGNDTIYGLGGNDVLYDGEGDDSVYGHDGDDIIHLEAGSDFADGGSGSDNIYDEDFEDDEILGGSGGDFIGVGGGSDYYDGGSDTDALVFNTGSQQINVDLSAGIISNDGYGYIDTIVNFENIYSHSTFGAQIKGDSSYNFVRVTQGNNTILVTTGGDWVDLESSGTDTIKIDFDYGALTLQNFVSGQDKIDVSYFAPVSNWSDLSFVQNGNNTTVYFAGSASSITLWNYTQNLLETDFIFRNFATNWDDTLIGTDVVDMINGLDGNDSIYGFDGDDQLSGGNGDDILYGFAGIGAACHNRYKIGESVSSTVIL